MSLYKHKLLRRQDNYLPASGSVVESNPTPTASFLAQNSAAASGVGSPPTGIPLVTSTVLDSLSTATTQSPTSTASTNTSASSGNQISLATVIGACVGAVVVLLLAVALALYCSKRQKLSPARYKSRNLANDVSRRRSHLEPWARMEDDERWDGPQGRERPMRQRPPSGPLGALFHRTTSNVSGEKSSEEHNRESVGTMQHFVKYHPGLAAEMASLDTVRGVDGEVVKPPPVLCINGRSLDMPFPTSWDGETVQGDSFMSVHSGSMSPQMMAMERSTPPATTSSLHYWERAEVLHVSQVDSDVSESGELRNPFSDGASSVKSRASLKGQNPFFSGRDYPVKRTLLADTHKNPFADERHSSSAIRSLIAALEEPDEQPSKDRIISVQSSVYSHMTADDGDSAVSVTAFPYPPTQIHVG